MRNYESIEYFVRKVSEGFYTYKDGELVNKEGKAVGYKSGKGNYLRISTRVKGKTVSALVHLIIFAYFHGIDELKRHETIDHLDGNKYNNRIRNLEGCTVEENNMRANPTMLGKENALAVKLMLQSGMGTSIIAEKFGVSQRTIYKIKNGETYGTLF